jgi:hypothetical protein
MQHVYDTYTEAFNHISSMPRIITLEQEVEFCATLRTLLENARSVLPRLARASKEISRYVDPGRLNKFIDDFLVRWAALIVCMCLLSFAVMSLFFASSFSSKPKRK